MKPTLLFALLTLFISPLSLADTPPTLRLGVMAGGTLAWELAALDKLADSDRSAFTLETVPLANQQAGKVALQAGSVDVIISDWIWVSSMRAAGNALTFYPYLDIAGALMVPSNSPIQQLSDLQGKRLGIAGGELDKNWLLLQALGQQQGVDLNQSLEKVFGAPPLLNQQLTSGRLDALLTYWQFAARLEAHGYRRLLSGEAIIQQLGIGETVPSLGYVFKQDWGDAHKAALRAFFAATKQAHNRLCQDDSTWQAVAPLADAPDAATQQPLRQRYCEGRIEQWGARQQQAAESLYRLIRQGGDNKLTGNAEQLQAGTFWSAD